MENSEISWTDHTFNPWIGCTNVSPGCDHCYAETQDHRWGKDRWGKGKPRERTGEGNWRKPLQWNVRAQLLGKRERVFCASMADVFDSDVDPVWRADLFALIRATPHLDWLLLTKRAPNIEKMLPADWGMDCPYPNVWLGCTVENQEQAGIRLPWLLGVPAVVHFVSYEPALGPLDLTRVMLRRGEKPNEPHVVLNALTGHVMGPDDILPNKVAWVIAGGESGRQPRPMHPDWPRAVRDQCRAAGVAFHFKQWGEFEPVRPYHQNQLGRLPDKAVRVESAGNIVGAGGEGLEYMPEPNTWWMRRTGKKGSGRELDGRTWDEFPEVRTP